LKFHVADATTDAGVVWRRKKDEGRFMYARDGDFWTTPFQCEWCWIVNLKGREMREDDPKDVLLIGYLRRMNLDIMWSREPSTVAANLRQLVKGSELSKELGLVPIDIPRGPWPVGDNCGVQLAVQILRSSQKGGRHVKDYQQFDTVRKLRSAYSNAYESGPSGINVGNLVFKAEKGRVYSLINAPADSMHFDRFMQGLKSRMGRLVIPDQGIDNDQVHGILDIIERDLGDLEVGWDEKRDLIMLGSFLVVCYGCSLRGNEGFFLERTELIRMIGIGKEGILETDGSVRAEGHVCAPLMGRFKNEQGEQRHVMVMVNESKSGINFRLWMERLVLVLKKEGHSESGEAGPAFCQNDGSMIYSYQMNALFQSLLERLKEEREDLFPKGADVVSLYGIHRSLRRGANSRATEEGVSKETRELINRWSSFEAKRGQRPSMSMAQHYLEIRLVLKRILEYSKAL
jgi:hypothetical protein